MRVLFFGDVVGENAVDQLAMDIPRWRKENRVDLVIVNIENSVVSHPDSPECGFGVSLAVVNKLIAAGVDVLTGGNHSWDAPSCETVMSHPQVVRPANIVDDLPGRGCLTLQVNGDSVNVINLMSAGAAGDRYRTIRPYEYFQTQSFEPGSITIVDFHAGIPVEKYVLAHTLDGKVAAVMGTHTHEPTLKLHRLPKGTYFVADVGMNGPSDGILGMGAQHFVKKEQQQATVDFHLAKGPLQLGAVLFDTEKTEILRLQDTNWL
ncbi:MAG: YmdB family metallophosphoesterase [Cyanobacteria bacterium J06623_4]